MEMIIKASLIKACIGEVPITLHPDGRVDRKPHLRTFRDGWRTLCFFLPYGLKRLLIHGIVLVVFRMTGNLILFAGALFAGTSGSYLQ